MAKIIRIKLVILLIALGSFVGSLYKIKSMVYYANYCEENKTDISYIDNNIIDVKCRVPEIVVSGIVNIKYNPKDGSVCIWDKESYNIDINIKYTGILELPNKCIRLKSSGRMLDVKYYTDDIVIKDFKILSYTYKNMDSLTSIEVGDYTIKRLIVNSLLEIKEAIDIDSIDRGDYCKILEKQISEFAMNTGYDGVTFNSRRTDKFNCAYSYKDMANVKYGYNKNKHIKHVDYIVIHSTDNPNASAKDHVKWLNRDRNSNAVHYYVDKDCVINTLDEKTQAWGVGDGNNRNSIGNHNSIQLEICEYENKQEQEKAINNTIEFIQKVLIRRYPKAKIVRHQDASGKYCPRVILDRVGGWGEFIGEIKGT